MQQQTGPTPQHYQEPADDAGRRRKKELRETTATIPSVQPKPPATGPPEPLSEHAQDEPFLTLGELAEYIKRVTGIRFGPSTMEKLCSPAINDGPKPACYIGKRPLFKPADVVAWARARLSAKPKASAHNWPDKPPKAERTPERAPPRAKAAKPKARSSKEARS
jgi:hypothetical protein